MARCTVDVIRGSLREQARETKIAAGQGKRSRYDLDKTAYDEELYVSADWLSEQRILAGRVHCSTRADGTENLVVHFSRPISTSATARRSCH